jgi:glyoxylase-like metal-dependent hydrolase (beta-lactamase superfamily II)
MELSVAFAERMFVLQYGAERVSKGLSLRGGDLGHLYWEPLVGVAVQTSAGWVLFDTGMSRRNHDSAEVELVYRGTDDRRAEPPWHLRPAPPVERSTWGLTGDPMAAALAQIGLVPGDLMMAVVSHLHWDHTGGIPTLAGAGVEVLVHADELAWGRSGRARFEDGFDAADWNGASTRWRTVDSETEVAPGVTVLPTPGHTPGHVSLQVELPSTGTWIFTADATDLAQNLLDAVPCGSCAGGTAKDEQMATESLQLLLARARAKDARLVPGHDQVVTTAIRHPPGGHR